MQESGLICSSYASQLQGWYPLFLTFWAPLGLTVGSGCSLMAVGSQVFSFPSALCCSVAKSCPILCDPMNCGMPGFLSFTISQRLVKRMFFESMMQSNHLILCHPLLLPSIFPSIRVFSNELALLTWCVPAHIGGLQSPMTVTSLFILLWQEIFHFLVVTVPPNIFKRATSCHFVPNEFGGYWRTLGRCAKCSVWEHSGCNPRSWDWA